MSNLTDMLYTFPITDEALAHLQLWLLLGQTIKYTKNDLSDVIFVWVFRWFQRDFLGKVDMYVPTKKNIWKKIDE